MQAVKLSSAWRKKAGTLAEQRVCMVQYKSIRNVYQEVHDGAARFYSGYSRCEDSDPICHVFAGKPGICPDDLWVMLSGWKTELFWCAGGRSSDGQQRSSWDGCWREICDHRKGAGDGRNHPGLHCVPGEAPGENGGGTAEPNNKAWTIYQDRNPKTG